MGLDWPDRNTRRLEDLSVWEVVRSQPTLLYDGSWLARTWWDVRHPPRWISWTPPWRRHKKACDDRYRAAKSPLTLPPSYCATCDVWHLTRWHPVFWLVLVFGEH